MKTALALIFSFCFLLSDAQTGDVQLDQRLKEYLQLTREKKFSELMEYIHPVLFTLAPKEELAKALEDGFNNEGINITIDSVWIKSISPVFIYQTTSYRKLDNYMEMSFDLLDKSALSDSATIAEIKSNLLEAFPQGIVTFDPQNQTFKVGVDDILIAIREDEKSHWKFLGYDEDQAELFRSLLPDAVITRFALKQ